MGNDVSSSNCKPEVETHLNGKPQQDGNGYDSESLFLTVTSCRASPKYCLGHEGHSYDELDRVKELTDNDLHVPMTRSVNSDFFGVSAVMNVADVDPEPGASTQLHLLIKNTNGAGKWEEVLKRMYSNADEVSQLDENCRTPLCLACADSETPNNVIWQLLAAFPQATSIGDKNKSYPLHFYLASDGAEKAENVLLPLIKHFPLATILPNKFGNTPLQVAIESDVSRKTANGKLSMLKTLIIENPRAVAIPNIHSSYPLHYAWKDNTSDLCITRLLLKVYPKAARIQNKYGATPIFMAVNWDASMPLLELLIHAYPAAVKLRDERGICSIASGWNLFVHQVKVENQKGAEKERERVKYNRKKLKMATSPYDLEGDVETWWHKMQLLLKAAYHNSISDPLPSNRKWRVLHATAAYNCPPELLKFVLTLYRNQLFIRDEHGNLPIHIAAVAPIYIKQPFETASDPGLSKVANAFPKATEIHDQSGRLPLHLALSSGKTWNEGISILVEYYPKSVRISDTVTKLYPFMLAAINDNISPSVIRSHAEKVAKVNFRHVANSKATPKASNTTNKSARKKNEDVSTLIEEYELARLNTIFELLRNAPDFTCFKKDATVSDNEKQFLNTDNGRLSGIFLEMRNDAVLLRNILEKRRKEWKEKLSNLEDEAKVLRGKKTNIEDAMMESRDDDNCRRC